MSFVIKDTLIYLLLFDLEDILCVDNRLLLHNAEVAVQLQLVCHDNNLVPMLHVANLDLLYKKEWGVRRMDSPKATLINKS